MLDASVIVSAVLNPRGTPRRAVDQALAYHRVALSDEVLTEVRTVLRRPKFARFVTPDIREEFLDAILSVGFKMAPVERVTACRDPKDDKYLELALAASAGAIVTGDADLLALHPFRGIPVLTPAAFLAA